MCYVWQKQVKDFEPKQKHWEHSPPPPLQGNPDSRATQGLPRWILEASELHVPKAFPNWHCVFPGLEKGVLWGHMKGWTVTVQTLRAGCPARDIRARWQWALASAPELGAVLIHNSCIWVIGQWRRSPMVLPRPKGTFIGETRPSMGVRMEPCLSLKPGEQTTEVQPGCSHLAANANKEIKGRMFSKKNCWCKKAGWRHMGRVR